ncbi:NAD-dependent epimerase/dehydratase family protein [Candidatus Methylobacter favarea]|uniref:NAD-dependent epimerase/dehydratase family protein n=1 Tax=Candidatus Methylobacter favarea TaxID=2707345 RepID=UPI00157BB7D0|nr:NAD-dependent epimerase/dehydratase family protein [Candidatus Methylobacter favarea]
MDEKIVGVLGATSMVGESLLPLLTQAGRQVRAYSRQVVNKSCENVVWRQLPPASSDSKPGLPISLLGGSKTVASAASGFSMDAPENIKYWLCVAPIWVLPEYLNFLEHHNARRIVVLSSTSRFTKTDSPDPEERIAAHRLADAEERIRVWAVSCGVEWVILRPTLIYGRGRDKNISEMARFICRFGFFPIFGPALGLRQPVHVADVAAACISALQTPGATNRDYNISGGETLTYKQMVCRTFAVLGRRPRLVKVPIGVFRFALACLRMLPRYQKWSVAMAERMNKDLVFNHEEATRDLGFKPRPLVLTAADVPSR